MLLTLHEAAEWAASVKIVSVPDHELIACDGKKKYTSERTVREVIERRSAAEGFRLHPYRCGRCGCMHISKHPPEVYLRRIQDSTAVAARTATARAAQLTKVSTGQSAMQAAMAAAGISSQVTEAAPRQLASAARAGRS